MYQGKFQKSPKSGAYLQNSEKSPIKVESQKQAPLPQDPPVNAEKFRLRPGTIIFYSVLLVFVLIFCILIGWATNALNDWLVRFEASQPNAKCEAVFAQLFETPNWEHIYALAENPGDITAQDYVAYMDSKVGDAKLTYIETSAGLSGNKKYIVRCGSEKVAIFTLCNATPDAEIPDWQLGTVEIFYNIPRFSVTVLAAPEYTVLVNGKELDDSHVIRWVTTKAEDYLPDDVHGYRINEYAVHDLTAQPDVEILDTQGNPLQLQYDSETRCYSVEVSSAAITEGHRLTLVTAAETYSKYMIGAATQAALRTCFDNRSDIYRTITSNTTWMQSYASYKLGKAEISDYYRYSDDYFSARVALTVMVTRKDGTVKDYQLDNTFFVKKSGSQWLVWEMINSNPQDTVTNVRLTYLSEDQVIHTEIVDATANLLTPPEITVPEGKTFSGWFIQTVDGNGGTTMELAFQPDENGIVRLPSNTVLEPMTLYALYQ